MKVFLTVRDIEDLAARGLTQVPIGEDVVLTDLAREKAAELGLALLQGGASPAPSPAPQAQASAVPAPTRAVIRETLAVGPKPRGCLHSHIEAGRVSPSVAGNAGRAAEAARGSSPDPTLDKLVAMIRQLNK